MAPPRKRQRRAESPEKKDAEASSASSASASPPRKAPPVQGTGVETSVTAPADAARADRRRRVLAALGDEEKLLAHPLVVRMIDDAATFYNNIDSIAETVEKDLAGAAENGQIGDDSAPEPAVVASLRTRWEANFAHLHAETRNHRISGGSFAAVLRGEVNMAQAESRIKALSERLEDAADAELALSKAERDELPVGFFTSYVDRDSMRNGTIASEAAEFKRQLAQAKKTAAQRVKCNAAMAKLDEDVVRHINRDRLEAAVSGMVKKTWGQVIAEAKAKVAAELAAAEHLAPRSTRGARR